MLHHVLSGLAFILILVDATGCMGPELRKVHTEHLGQLTGANRHLFEHIGITGTDIGVSFVEPGDGHRLIFLFGDSFTQNYQRTSQDSAAWTQRLPLPDKNQIPKMNWFATTGEFLPLKIPDIDLGGMNVPVEGLAIGDKTYIFASTGWDWSRKRHCCSVLSHTEGVWPDGLEGIVLDHKVPSDKFVNISAFVQEDIVWIFGSGAFRQSGVYLAKASPSRISDRMSWQYYKGMRGHDPEFGDDESSAKSLVDSRCVGELSVRRHPELGYLMLYNCNMNGSQASYGIYLGRADHPWGPWDLPINIFNPDVDQGYGVFLHQKLSHVGYDDGLAEPGLHHVCMDCPCHADKPVGHEFEWREECWGSVYGPYLVPEWFSKTSDGGYSIVYTLSSWVPYQVHLVRTILAKQNDQRPQALHYSLAANTPGSHLVNPNFADGLHGWQSLGDSFVVFQDHEGRSRLTTSTPEKGSQATGTLFQDFTVDVTTKALGFWVHGGDATVRLYRGLDIVRETRGRSGHEPRRSPETKVCWQLDEYAGETLRIAIFDDKTEDWGFIGVGSFQFLTTCSELQ